MNGAGLQCMSTWPSSLTLSSSPRRLRITSAAVLNQLACDQLCSCSQSQLCVFRFSGCFEEQVLSGKMVDVAALVIGVILFVVLSPGLVLQIPGDERPVEFTNLRTSLPSVVVHAVVFTLLFWLLQLLFHVHGGA